jgi:hypothetical protein
MNNESEFKSVDLSLFCLVISASFSELIYGQDIFKTKLRIMNYKFTQKINLTMVHENLEKLWERFLVYNNDGYKEIIKNLVEFAINSQETNVQ